MTIRKGFIWRGLIDMSWDRFNLFNLNKYSRAGPERELNKTTFQLRFRAKQLAIPYHAGHLTQTQFRRLQRKILPKVDRTTKKSKLPVPPTSMLMFGFMERRVDVALFRACFVPSIWEARHLIRKGYVKVNGDKVKAPGYSLADGDIVQVDPSRLSLLRPKKVVAENSAEGEEAKETENTSVKEEEKKDMQKIVKFMPKENYNFQPIPYMAPWIFVPEYLEVNYNNATLCFLREPLIGPGKSEIPSPFDEIIHQRAFDFYLNYRKL